MLESVVTRDLIEAIVLNGIMTQPLRNSLNIPTVPFFL